MRFRPPKTNMEACIQDLISLFAPQTDGVPGSGKFCTDKFKSSMSTTMIKTGCCPIPSVHVSVRGVIVPSTDDIVPLLEAEMKDRKFIPYNA